MTNDQKQMAREIFTSLAVERLGMNIQYFNPKEPKESTKGPTQYIARYAIYCAKIFTEIQDEEESDQ